MVGDVLVNELTDSAFYLKLAEHQYKLLEEYVLTHPSKGHTYSFFMSEVSVWLCGMHLGYIKKDLALFRENEARMHQCY